jgi:hypothetical protein
MADRHFQKSAKIPGMIPAVAAMPATIVAALVATMVTVTRHQYSSPIQTPQDPRDLLVVVYKVFRHCSWSR